MKTPRPSLRNVGIKIRDGITLAADVYLPEGDGPWPAAVVYVPYRKDAWIGIRYQGYLQFLAASGYAAAIADFRGTGSSGGTKADAFEAVESDDVYDLVEGLAAQPWCDGKVGIWGVSYGGITALRAAAAGPPHLGAVVAIEGSTDPYEYEVMRGGAPGLAMIVGEWASMMLCLNALPVIGGTPGSDVQAVDAQHIDALTPWQFAWRDHPTRDTYWQGRAVSPVDIAVPTMIITSWRDTNPVGAWRDFGAVKGPRRIISGPWLHGLPDKDPVDPIHSLREVVRWFDRWLRAANNDVDREDPVNVYVLGSGRWESYPDWPPATRDWTLYLSGDSRLAGNPPGGTSEAVVPFDATVGICGGLGMAHPPCDQGRDDARSVIFDTEPLEEPAEIISAVEVTLNVRFADSQTDVAVRVTDVDEMGNSTLITRGHLRLSNPPPYLGRPVAPPGAVINVHCQPTRYHVAAGHRIRLAVAGTDFPAIWPVSKPTNYRLVIGGPDASYLRLPTLAEPPGKTVSFDPPDRSLACQGVISDQDSLELSSPDDIGRAVVRATSRTAQTTPDGQNVHLDHTYEVSAVAGKPALTQLTSMTCLRVEGPVRRIAIETNTSSSTDVATAATSMTIDGVHIFTRSWRHSRSESPGDTDRQR